MTTGRRWLSIIAVSATIVIFGLGFIEVTVRVLHPEATRPAILGRLERERSPWARPSVHFHHAGNGIYELKFPHPSEARARRVMIVGDSFVMGHGVGEADRFGTLLQRNLRHHVKIDVLAASSYSPIVYRNIVRIAMASARYTAVAVFVDQTDPADDLIYKEDLQDESSHLFDLSSMQDRARVIERTSARMIEGLSGWANPRRLALINLLNPISLPTTFPKDNRHYHYIHLSYLDREQLIKQFELAPDSEVTREMEHLLFRHLDEIVAVCGNQQVPLLLAANPWEYQASKRPRVHQIVPGPYPRENRLEHIITQRYGQRPGVTVIPLTQSFRSHTDPSSLFLHHPSNEIHWNQEGHVLVEQVLRASLDQKVAASGP